MVGQTKTERFNVQLGEQALSGKVAHGGKAGLPVIFAVHGGTYTCDYFDVPGYSLLDRATAAGFDMIAIDRPGYGQSTQLPKTDAIIDANAAALNAAIPELLKTLGFAGRPVFLIGHSIGGAIALTLASAHSGWALVGVAVSGVGHETPPEHAENYAHLPPMYFVDLPTPMKDQVMFGPADTHSADMPAASHIANTHVPRAELVDITGGWKDRVSGIVARITVPVHYRQGAHEALWLNSGQRVTDFGKMFTASPNVDAQVAEDAGHCIDYHIVGGAFQTSQLAFAAKSSFL